jgi:hypothetical protein
MPLCQFPIFCCFCVSEKLHMKYSQNWTKQKPKSLITWHEDGVQRREGDRPEASRTYWWRGPAPAALPGVWPHGPPPDIALPPIYSPRRENPRGPNSFPENILQAPAVIDTRSGGSRSSSRHTAWEGNHHRRPSSSPCLPPEWCVSSIPWTMGP